MIPKSGNQALCGHDSLRVFEIALRNWPRNQRGLRARLASEPLPSGIASREPYNRESCVRISSSRPKTYDKLEL